MDKYLFYSNIDSLPVFDAHTHLVGEKLRASDFWEIAHYFWFLRELIAAGYPAGYESMTAKERIPHFVKAFHKTQSTAMNYSVRRIFKDLYDIEITDEKSVAEANERVRASSSSKSWQREVAAKGNLKRAIINREEHKDFEDIPEVMLLLPRIDGPIHGLARDIMRAGNKSKAAEIAKAKLEELVNYIRSLGAKGIMTTLHELTKRTYKNDGTGFSDYEDCLIFILHSLCAEAEKRDWVVQFFLGIGSNYGSESAPINRTDRVLNLYGLFERYKCKFDIVMGSEIINLDVVQAAVIYPNVYAGGMWWYNFRPSSFHDSMNKRFEALPSNKSYLSISDSRCIEWCYGKNVLIKKLAADFLWQKISEGWVDEKMALGIAEDWLSGTPDRLYGGK